MTGYHHIATSHRQALEVGGAAGLALERATEAAARAAAADALKLAAEALEADNLAEALRVLTLAGLEASQALEVGYWWCLPQGSGRGTV